MDIEYRIFDGLTMLSAEHIVETTNRLSEAELVSTLKYGVSVLFSFHVSQLALSLVGHWLIRALDRSMESHDSVSYLACSSVSIFFSLSLLCISHFSLIIVTVVADPSSFSPGDSTTICRKTNPGNTFYNCSTYLTMGDVDPCYNCTCRRDFVSYSCVSLGKVCRAKNKETTEGQT